MRALITSPGTTHGLSLGEAPEPEPAPNEAVIQASALSINFGDIGSAATAEPGLVLGWDAAGVVTAAAADGTGPAVGTRVLTFSYVGAWAEHRAVGTTEIAVIPEAVEFGVAAAIPVAGVTALRALLRSGPLLGRRVLVTGASGGVGRFAVQLAARAGAHVVAQAHRGAGLSELGAHQVVPSAAGLENIDVVVDNVGGQQLVDAWQSLTPTGIIQSVGWTSGEPATFPVYSTVGPSKSLRGFNVGTDFGVDMTYLLDLVARDQLFVDIGWRGSWQQFEEAATALKARQATGKAVLDVD